MKSCYVVMATSYSPIALVIPSPKAVFLSRKEAENFCKAHNENTLTRTECYVRKAEFKDTTNETD